MVRHIAHRFFLPGGDREDLAQEARWGVTEAMRTWDSSRGVPFSSFAWLCATREARMAITCALAHKHRVLTTARSLDGDADRVPVPHSVQLRSDEARMPIAGAEGDKDPVAKTLARERLAEIVVRARGLSMLERQALAMATTDHSHREIATALCVGPRAVNNALQRARHKLREVELAAA